MIVLKFVVKVFDNTHINHLNSDYLHPIKH